MAKLHCERHQRYVPYCDDCKAVVKEAEEQAAREEQSEALQEGVGFPGAGDVPVEPGDVTIQPEPQGPQSTPGPYTDGEEEQTPEFEGPLGEGAPGPDALPDPWADGKTPEEGQDVGHWLPPEDRFMGGTEVVLEAEGEFDPEPAVEIDGDGNVVPISDEESDVDLPPMSPEDKASIEEIVDALKAGKIGFAMTEDNAIEVARVKGRKEVIAMVREYFSDSIDTGAFQLLAYLEKRCR